MDTFSHAVSLLPQLWSSFSHHTACEGLLLRNQPHLSLHLPPAHAASERHQLPASKPATTGLSWGTPASESSWGGVLPFTTWERCQFSSGLKRPVHTACWGPSLKFLSPLHAKPAITLRPDSPNLKVAPWPAPPWGLQEDWAPLPAASPCPPQGCQGHVAGALWTETSPWWQNDPFVGNASLPEELPRHLGMKLFSSIVNWPQDSFLSTY